MKKLGQRLLVFIVGSLIVDGIYYAISNVMDGKDILGHNIDRKETKVDWRGRIHLGENDYLVE